MRPFQRKCCILVVEICHLVLPVVAGSTIFAIIEVVLGDKSLVVQGVADGAGSIYCCKFWFILVAAQAGQWGGVVIDLVAHQAETRLGMVVECIGCSRWIEIHTPVVGVAAEAILRVLHRAVSSCTQFNLLLDRIVAIHAKHSL